MAQLQRLDIGQDQLFLTLELVRHQIGQHLEIHIQQGGQRANVDHVLEQLALARILVLLITDTRQRQTDDGDVVAQQAQVQWLGVVIDKVTAGLYLRISWAMLCGFTDRQISTPPRRPR